MKRIAPEDAISGGHLESFADILPLLILIALVILVVPGVLRVLRTRRRGFRVFGSTRQSARNMADPKTQIEVVSQAGFVKRRIMNSGEYAVFQVLERTLRRIGGGYRVMAQTSLGELIQPKGKGMSRQLCREAHASINSKRLDFAIIDRWGMLALAVEYQGSGHHLGRENFMRDAVKREALRRAGVTMIEVAPNWTAGELQAQVTRALGQDPTPGPVSTSGIRAGIRAEQGAR